MIAQSIRCRAVIGEMMFSQICPLKELKHLTKALVTTLQSVKAMTQTNPSHLVTDK